MMGIFVMLNNFFHDFSVRLLFASLILVDFLYRRTKGVLDESKIIFFKDMYSRISKVVIACWTFIIIGGIIRTLAYEKYEWMEAAGKGQIAALIVKHILLVSFVVWGVIIQRRLKRELGK